MSAVPAMAGCGRLTDATGAPLRPGGAEIGAALIAHAGLRPGDRVVDIGCGRGATAALLTETGLAAVGLDRDGAALGEARALGVPVVAGDALALPIADGALDGVLAECVLSLLPRQRALAEWARVLKPGGVLALADLYARVAVADGASPYATVPDLRRALAAAGFSLDHVEDRSAALAGFVARFIFAHGSLAPLWGDCASVEAARRARIGYGLFIARRTGEGHP